MGSGLRIGALELFELPLECAFPPPEPGVERSPQAVRFEHRGQRRLVCVSASARRQGVQAGSTESEARARLPELDVRAQRPHVEAAQLEAAAELMTGFGPEVELCPPRRLLVEFGRSRRLHPDWSDRDWLQRMVSTLAQAGHRATGVVASEPDLALTLLGAHVASGQEGIQVYDVRTEREQLDDLPLQALVWTDPRFDPDGTRLARMQEALANLRWLGLDRVHDLARFEGRDLPGRLAEVGHELLARARGRNPRPLRTFVPGPRLLERFELDRGTEQLEPVLFILRRLVNRLALRLDARGRSAGSLALTWSYEPDLDHRVVADHSRPPSSRQIRTDRRCFARATRDPKWMFEVLKTDLSLPGFVRWVELEALQVERDDGAQLDLFTRHARRVEEAAQLVTRLQSALGADSVCAPEPVDTHRPERAWRAGPFDVEKALQAPPQPRRPASGPHLRPASDRIRPEAALPEVNETLSVIGHGAPDPELPSPIEPASAWPRPLPRSPDDEPPPPLPPRPTRLFRPQRLRVLDVSDEGVCVSWQNRSLQVMQWGDEERLETEWWTRTPLVRKYRTLELDDGSRLWVFEDPSGALYAHGIFD